jgi:hypothetical protein
MGHTVIILGIINIFKGMPHPERRAEVEDRLHHRHLRPGRHCPDPGSHYVGHRPEAEEVGEQDLQLTARRTATCRSLCECDDPS